MSTSKKALHENLRNGYIDRVSKFLASEGEEILVTGTNEIALPVVDAEGNDEYIVITFKVPTGSRDGDPYDGYSVAEDFKLRTAEKTEKAAEAAKRKAAKIEKDRAERAAKAKAKAEHEAAEKAKAE